MDKVIFIIRHGETDLNLEDRFQGKGSDPSLNETGKKQSLLFYEKYKDIPFAKIYTSTLKRSIETVEPFAGKGIPVEQCAELDEISWGIKEGMFKDTLISCQYDELKSLWMSGQLKAKMEGGESPLDVQLRLNRFLLLLKSRKGESPVLVSMHGRAMRIFLCMITHTPLTEMHRFVHQNLGLYELHFHNHEVSMIKYNDTLHLTSMESSCCGKSNIKS